MLLNSNKYLSGTKYFYQGFESCATVTLASRGSSAWQTGFNALFSLRLEKESGNI
jgi:hypothetical protein